jgi:hypothetical protein
MHNMKKTLLIALLMAGAASVFGQGAINWGNQAGGRFPIYGPDPGNPSSSQSGQSSLGNPPGATAYNGALLQGTGFTFDVFAGPSAAPEGSLVLIAQTTFRTSANPAALPAGLVNGGTTTVPGVTAGQTAHYEIRVWNNQGGTILTWAQAQAAGTTAMGQSALLTSAALGGSLTDGTPVANPNTVFTSFNIAQVPEPTTFALAGLGAAALLIFRRRK